MRRFKRTLLLFVLLTVALAQRRSVGSGVATNHTTTTATSLLNLPLGDINVVVLTDVHSWVGGHGTHESPELDADFGNVLSFYERLRYACQEEAETKHDLWFVMNGDFVDGTGLSTLPPESLVPLVEKMPFDAVNIGNHELYKSETVEFLTRPGGLVHWFGNRFITSNVLLNATREPMGERYRFLKGQKSTVLAFGFLYDMRDASPLVRVETVEDVVQSEWFVRVLREEQAEFDAILVLAHMDLQDPLLDYILDAIRNECGSNMPVQFITGHTHYRGYHTMDTYSSSFEAGRFLDTIGFVSFPTKKTATLDANATDLFQHDFIDANVRTLRNKLGIERLATESGVALSKFIRSTQEEMGLNQVVGCAPRTFHLEAALGRKDSLWGLFVEQVIPTQFYRFNSSMMLIQGKQSALWYSLFAGNVTVDDVQTVSPFNDTIHRVASNVLGSSILSLNETLNQNQSVFYLPMLPDYVLSGKIVPHKRYDLFASEFEVDVVVSAMQDISSESMQSESWEVAITSLWFSFVQETWPCSSRPHMWPGTNEFLQESDSALQFGLYGFVSIAVIDISTLVVLFGVIVYRKLYVKPPSEIREGSNRNYDTWESGTFA